MEPLLQIILATLLVSGLSLVGIFLSRNLKKHMVHRMVSFAAGALLGAAFLDLIPEGVEASSPDVFFYYVLSGFFLSFILERFIFWYHCHEGVCKVHPFNYLSLIGDALHNFLDGIIIAVAFMTDTTLGITATVAIIFHEIPQELGEYFILLHGGFSRAKALAYNFLSAVTAIVGALFTYFFLGSEPAFVPILVGLAAGQFIYIAATDLVPELKKIPTHKESLIHFLLIVFGVVAIALAKTFFGGH